MASAAFSAAPIYNGSKLVSSNVLSSYSPLKIEGLNWGIITKIDLPETYQHIYQLQQYLSSD